jgi:hypothetical protein
MVTKIATGLCLTGLAAFLFPTFSTQASIITQNATIANIFSTSGNANIGWTDVVDTSLNLELDLRAKLNGSGDIRIVGDSSYDIQYSGTYGNNWNIEFSVNVNANGTKSTTLASSGYTFWLVADDGLVNTKLSNIGDNYYGTSTTTGKGKSLPYDFFIPSFAGKTYSIMANSEPMFNDKQNINVLGYATTGHTFTLLAEDGSGNVVLGDTITVDGGYGAVPEPTTLIAGGMLLLPFGVKAVRSMRKRIKA